MRHNEATNGKVNYCRKNMNEIQEDCRRWAAEIGKSFQPDLIVFVAKSGFLFAEPMAGFFQCEMADIVASRPASSLKDKMKKVIHLLPERVISAILRSPVMYRFHGRKTERNVELTKRYCSVRKKPYQNILLVDDSVDTGWTLKKVQEIIMRDFPDAQIKTAGYSVIADSKSRIAVDYFRYTDTVILTATFRKSSEYDLFLAAYHEWTLQADNGGAQQ